MSHLTKWTNPLEYGKRVTLEIFKSPGQIDTHVFEPGETIQLPGEYDRAIHDVRNGVVVGGLAPMLRRDGQRELVHSALAAEDSKVVAEQASEISKLQDQVAALTRSAEQAMTTGKAAIERAESAEKRAAAVEAEKLELEQLLETDEPRTPPKAQKSATKR